MLKNVVLYTRVSTGEQVEGFSIDAQKTELEKYCVDKDYKIIKYYSDAGITGTNIIERKQFRALLSDIKTGNIDAILIWKLSRISRKMVDLVNILQYLEENNVALISITENINTSMGKDKALIYMAGIFAEMERDNIVEGAKSGMKQRAREGKWNGGTPPLGYSYSKENGLAIVEDEALIVKKIFELYTDEDYGYSKICQYLNKRLDIYATRRKNAWSYSTVKQIIDNPTYVGKIRWGVRSDWKEKRRAGITDDFILSEGIHESIISDDLWERTKSKRALVGIKPKKKVHITYLISGLPKCPECGSSMTSHRIKKKNKSPGEYYRYYACSRWANTKTECKPNLVYAQKTEDFVINTISDFVNQSNVVSVITDNLSGDADLHKIVEEIEIIKTSLVKSRNDHKSYVKYLSDEEKKEIIGEDTLLEIIKELRLKIEQLTAELEQLEIKKKQLQNNELDFENILGVMKIFEVAFRGTNKDEQINIIHNLVKEIKINPSDKITGRTVKEIILHFNEIDLMKINKNKQAKSYEVIYDTVRLS